MPVIDIDGLRVAYTDAGSGLAVVFVPGLAGSKEWFCYQASALADHHRIVSYDLRRARSAQCTLDLLADDLARFLSRLRVHSAVVAGHGFGGLVALQFAALHPERCLGLVLSSTTPCFPRLLDEELLSNLLPGELSFESWFARLWARLARSKRQVEDESDPLAYLARNNAQIDRSTLDARLHILRGADLTGLVGGIGIPTLIVAGAQDPPYILAGSQIMEEAIGDASLEIIEDAGHFCFYTRHDLFNSVLSDFLAHGLGRP